MTDLGFGDRLKKLKLQIFALSNAATSITLFMQCRKYSIKTILTMQYHICKSTET